MTKSLPAYRAYTVRKATEDSKKDAWIAIGAAWSHRDQKGFDVILDALPVNGHVVLRLNEPNFDEPRQERTPQRRSFENKAPQQAPQERRRGAGQRWK